MTHFKSFSTFTTSLLFDFSGSAAFLCNLCGVCRSGKKARILDAEGLALGSQIATSKKRARDLMDGSFHRCVCVSVYRY